MIFSGLIAALTTAEIEQSFAIAAYGEDDEHVNRLQDDIDALRERITDDEGRDNSGPVGRDCA